MRSKLGPGGLDTGKTMDGLRIGDRVNLPLLAGEVAVGVVETINMPYQVGMTFQTLDNALLFIECESKTGPVGIWLSTYDVAEDVRERWQRALDAFADQVLAHP